MNQCIGMLMDKYEWQKIASKFTHIQADRVTK